MKIRRILSSIGIALLLSGSAFAAVTSNAVVTAQTPSRGVLQFLQGTDAAGTYKTLYTGGANSSRCNAIWVTNNDASAAHLVTCQIVNGGVKYGGAAMTTVASAGFANGDAAQNLLAPGIWTGLPLDSDNNYYIQLNNGDTLQCTFATALTSTDVINLVANCADF